MAKSIELIKEEETEQKQDNIVGLMGDLMSMDKELKSMMELVKKISQSGVIEVLKALIEKYGDVTSVVFNELAEPENSNFIRNLLTLYTLLSRINPELLRKFMENLADSIQNADTNKTKPPLGLFSLGRELRDEDISAGIRVLLSAAKGFTKKDDKPR
jgi:uncharacterized protein YjgD (DUF1641 family)